MTSLSKYDGVKIQLKYHCRCSFSANWFSMFRSLITYYNKSIEKCLADGKNPRNFHQIDDNEQWNQVQKHSNTQSVLKWKC